MRILVILFLLFIFYSLGSALYFVMRDKGGSSRAVKALTIRVALSVSLFILLMVSYRLGWIGNHI